jgi:hypothetical protein
MEKYTPIKKSPIFFILLAAFLAVCGLFTPNLTPESEPAPQMMTSTSQIDQDMTTDEFREHDRSRVAHLCPGFGTGIPARTSEF